MMTTAGTRCCRARQHFAISAASLRAADLSAADIQRSLGVDHTQGYGVSQPQRVLKAANIA